MNFSAYDAEGRRKYLASNEGERFLRAIVAGMPEWEEAFCKTLYYTGCRMSECLNLGPENLDAGEHVLRIRTLKKRGRVHVRRVPIPSVLTAALMEISPKEDRFWYFSRSTAWRIVHVVMRLSEIEGPQACAKGLRHGFGVRAALAGIPVTQIQEWMGHSSLKTTAIYLDVRDAEERELMRRTWGDIR